MKYEDKYPNVKPGQIYEAGNYIISKNRDNCCICGSLTCFVDINSEAYICSEECDETFYNEMFKHAMKFDL